MASCHQLRRVTNALCIGFANGSLSAEDVNEFAETRDNLRAKATRVAPSGQGRSSRHLKKLWRDKKNKTKPAASR